MARQANAKLLDNGDLFPSLTLDLVTGEKLTVPADLKQSFNVILVNRGSWCPFCNGQLKQFQAGLAKLSAEGIGVVSLSADPLEKAKSVVTENKIEFPVAYGASVDALAETLGVFYEPAPSFTTPFMHAAGFVLGPGGKVVNAVYSSGAIGRLVWQDSCNT